MGMSLPGGSTEGQKQGHQDGRGKHCGQVFMDPCPVEPRAVLSCAIGLEGLNKAEGCTSSCCFSFVTDGKKVVGKSQTQHNWWIEERLSLSMSFPLSRMG